MKEILFYTIVFLVTFAGGFTGALFGQVSVWFGFFQKNLRDKWGMWPPKKPKVKK